MPAISDTKYLTKCGMREVPHLNEKAINDFVKGTPSYLLPARLRGDPVLGVGRIYPYDIDEYLLEDPFEKIPDTFPRCFALDPSPTRVAALWAAIDEHSDTVHCYSEHYARKLPPESNVVAIKQRGAWIPGCADPAARAHVSAKDGLSMLQQFNQCGLKVEMADNAIEAGLKAVETRITTGRLKVYRTLRNFAFEYGTYARDDKGRIIKRADHLMDCLRYLCMTGIYLARTKPIRRTYGFGSSGVADPRAGF